ncbi:MAG: hypothetical protein ACNA7W_05480 [Pseudomonadales bacterium]
MFSFRRSDRSQSDTLANDFFVDGTPVTTFRDPVSGNLVEAQPVRAGIDRAVGAQTGRPNQAFGLDRDPSQCVFARKGSIDGNDVCSDTNGFNVEQFDQAAVQFDAEWRLHDRLSIKYIFGYNDLLYERITDDDLVSSTVSDRQFFVDHEAEEDRAPSYGRCDLRAAWREPSNRWVVSGFVNNVTDERGIRQILRTGEEEGFRRSAQVSEPRMFGLEVSYNLGG